MDETQGIGALISDLESTADWRARVAEEYPEDTRNARAIEILRRLANEIGSMEGSPILDRYLSAMEFLTDEGTGHAADELMAACDWENDYRRCIGFSEFPDTAEEYLTEILGRIRDAAPSLTYLLGKET